MILPPITPLALGVMSLCQKFVKCQKFKSCQKVAMPLLQTTRHYYAPPRGLKVTEGAPYFRYVMLGPRDPKFTGLGPRGSI